MPSFSLTNKAIADLLEIGRYTEEHWGKVQRDKYLSLIDESFSSIAQSPTQGQDCSDINSREQEIVFIPQKLSYRLVNYVRDKNIQHDQRIFPLSYAGARKIVVNVGDMLGIKLRPHDLRRHAATYASRAGVPIEIISKIILRH